MRPTSGSWPSSSNQSGKPPMERSSTRMRVAPRKPISPASVTTSDGRPRNATKSALQRGRRRRPASSATTTASPNGAPASCSAASTHGREAHHRRDREVDLAVDDHEGHDHDDDHLLDRELEHVHEVAVAEVERRDRDVHEDDDDEDRRSAAAPSARRPGGHASVGPRCPAARPRRVCVSPATAQRRRSRWPTAKSTATAMRISAPRMRVAPELADLLGTRSRLWSRMSIRTAPSSAPTSVPAPPTMLTPPTTAAAIGRELEALPGRHGDVAEAGQEQEAGQARERRRRRRTRRG